MMGARACADETTSNSGASTIAVKLFTLQPLPSPRLSRTAPSCWFNLRKRLIKSEVVLTSDNGDCDVVMVVLSDGTDNGTCEDGIVTLLAPKRLLQTVVVLTDTSSVGGACEVVMIVLSVGTDTGTCEVGTVMLSAPSDDGVCDVVVSVGLNPGGKVMLTTCKWHPCSHKMEARKLRCTLPGVVS